MEDETLGIWWGVNFPAAYQVFFHDGFHIGLGNWMGRWEKTPKHLLDRVVHLDRFQRLVRRLDAVPREVHVHLLPWTSDPGATYTDNVMLVGDAGGFPCPLEAEGVYPAMLTARIAATVAAEAIRQGDTSREALRRYEEQWRKSSVGVEFETGRELVNLWKDLPFDPGKNMAWFIPALAEILGGPFDWSQPHSIRTREIVRALSDRAPQAVPFLVSDLIPFLKAALREEPGTLGLRSLLSLASVGMRACTALRKLSWNRRKDSA